MVKNVAYTVPWYAYTYALVYRADLAAKAGIKAPTTWDAMVPFLKALQGAGAAHGLGADIGWDNFNGQDAAMYAWQAGGTLLSPDGAWTLDTPAMVRAMEYNASFFGSGAADIAGPTFLDSRPYFVGGRTAAMITGPWVLGLLDADANQNGWTAAHVATAPLPAGPGGNVSFSAGGTWGVLAGSRNADASWKLIRHMSRPEHPGRPVSGIRLDARGRLRLGRPVHREPAPAESLSGTDEEHPGVPRSEHVAAGRDPAGRGDRGRCQGHPHRPAGRREHPVVRREPRHRKRNEPRMTVTIAPGRRRSRTARRTVVAWAFLAPFTLVFLLYTALPTVAALGFSLTDLRGTDLRHPLAVAFTGPQNYLRLFQDASFLRDILNTAVFVVVGVPLTMGLGFALAVAFNSGVRRLRGVFRTVFFAPVVTNVVAVAMIWQYAFNADGT